jgi:1-deoxyxylulose-5-phosphate synthase
MQSDGFINRHLMKKIVALKKALELGINFFNTANSYSEGTSEAIVGRALKDYANRDEVVIATRCISQCMKVQMLLVFPKRAIMSEIDHSLKRLGTDYVHLYQIHRWDYNTPIEETMKALHDVVKAGKARYIGASSLMSWQFLKANKYCT